MRKLIVPAAVALAMSSGAAMASCNLPNGNWTCEENTEEVIVATTYVRAGSSHMCQVFDSIAITTTYSAINPGGHHVENKDGVADVSEPSDPVKREENEVCPAGTP